MLKKSLVILAVFCVILFASSFAFAANVQDGMSNAGRTVGNGVETVFNATGNTLQSAGNGISNMMNDAGRGMGNMVNGIEDGMDNGMMGQDANTGDDSGFGMANGTDNGYTANRTAATGATDATNNTLVWVILAVAAVAIIALVWYYATQTNDRHDERH